ncbi:hypothetical protein [Bradyrhizobium sp.]
MIMENPTPRFGLSDAFRVRLIYLPFFHLNQSLANWSDGLVLKTVQTQREMIPGVLSSLHIQHG